MLNTAYEEDARRQSPIPPYSAPRRYGDLLRLAPDVDTAYAYLRAHGVAAKEPKVAHYGMNIVPP